MPYIDDVNSGRTFGNKEVSNYKTFVVFLAKTWDGATK